ncbi:MAG: c-type cytochrome [Deltaproteobacteria bacterium]|nr:MAG: c-type cytochrome [Deltaproteobacteria bacterium]
MNELLRRLLFLPPQSSSVARTIDTLHYSVILATMAGVTLAAAVTGVFLLRYRRRTPVIPLTPHIVAPLWLEAGVVGGLLGLFCLWWVIGFAQYRTLQTPPADAIPVYVTAKQWMWKFAYPDGPSSSEMLVVPVGRPVKLIMTSRDVIHSFYVAEFRIKQDVVPGRAVTTWFEATEAGTYDVLCTQYCGTRHSFMRAQVVALAPEDYARWLGGARTPLALPGAKGDGQGLAERGHQVAAERGCLRCHSTDGSPFIGPTWANAFGRRRPIQSGQSGQPGQSGGSVLVDEAYLTESMMDPRAVIAAGFQPVMPSYQGALTPAETAAIVEYIRSLRDVRPTQVVPPPAAPITFPATGVAPAPPPTPATPGAVR